MNNQPPNSISSKTDSLPDSLSHKNYTLIPQGQVAIATIIGATLADGLTPISIAALSNTMTTYYAAANMIFTEDHIGQAVTCIEVHTHSQLVITGVVMQSQVSDVNSPSLLDEAIAHTLKPQDQNRPIDEIDEIDGEVFNQSADQSVEDDIEPFGATDEHYHKHDAEYDEGETYQQESSQQYTDTHTIIRGEQSIVLQCGASSLMLLADGRIKINGKYIHSRASHVHRIAGSTVKVN